VLFKSFLIFSNSSERSFIFLSKLDESNTWMLLLLFFPKLSMISFIFEYTIKKKINL